MAQRWVTIVKVILYFTPVSLIRVQPHQEWEIYKGGTLTSLITLRPMVSRDSDNTGVASSLSIATTWTSKKRHFPAINHHTLASIIDSKLALLVGMERSILLIPSLLITPKVRKKEVGQLPRERLVMIGLGFRASHKGFIHHMTSTTCEPATSLVWSLVRLGANHYGRNSFEDYTLGNQPSSFPGMVIRQQ